MTFFLKGDIVKTKGGKEGTVTKPHKGDKIVEVDTGDLNLTCHAIDLTLVKAIDGWTGSAEAYAAYAPTCSHWRDEFFLPDGKAVYLSRLKWSHGKESNKGKGVPDRKSVV